MWQDDVRYEVMCALLKIHGMDFMVCHWVNS